MKTNLMSIAIGVVALMLMAAVDPTLSHAQTQVGSVTSPGVASIVVSPATLITAFETEISGVDISAVAIYHNGTDYYLQGTGINTSTSDSLTTNVRLHNASGSLTIATTGSNTVVGTCTGCRWCRWTEGVGCVAMEVCGDKLCNEVTENTANGPGWLGSFY